MTRVERRLPAADLPARNLDLEAGIAQQRCGVCNRVGKREIPKTGRE